ncbi:hypothetical protein JXA88_05260 [Candidatus Fermentibacteria bacterium]|nr:hypothetical protein [Candidatus Fermentibacteria bacterium]
MHVMERVVRMSVAFAVGGTAMAALAAASLPSTAAPEKDQPYLHPRANLVVWPSPGEDVEISGTFISPRAAADSATLALMHRGVQRPLICEARWIAGSVSGYLVDAIGDLTIEGLHYSVFRIGIRDGAEAQYGEEFCAGSEFVFIALGWDSAGAQIWYPPPGPDHHPAEDESLDELLAYEFLLDREAFETLLTRYARGANNE